MARFTPICVACRREMRCKKNDYLFSDYDAAAVWAGDMYECEGCKAQVVVGVGRAPWACAGDDGYVRYRLHSQLELVR